MTACEDGEGTVDRTSAGALSSVDGFPNNPSKDPREMVYPDLYERKAGNEVWTGFPFGSVSRPGEICFPDIYPPTHCSVHGFPIRARKEGGLRN